MNPTYDGRYYVCPDGTPEFQAGYQDAMLHHGQDTTPLFEDGAPWGEQTDDYQVGYRQGWEDAKQPVKKPAKCEACGGPMHEPTWGCTRPKPLDKDHER